METLVSPAVLESLSAGPQYRGLSRLAVASLVLGLLSLSAPLSWLLHILPLLGILAGIGAMRRISRTPEELAGSGIALAGIGLSVLFWVAGIGWLIYAQRAEVPHGYTAVAYKELQPDPDTPGERIPKRAFELEGKRIFLKGYMYPGRQQFGLRKFLVSRDNGSCQFCLPNPRPTDLIRVELAGDLRANYSPKVVHLGGILRIEPPDSVSPWGGVAYRLEADYLVQ